MSITEKNNQFKITFGLFSPRRAWHKSSGFKFQCFSSTFVPSGYPTQLCGEVYSVIHSFICSFIHSFLHLFIHSFVLSFVHSLIHSFVRSFLRSFIHSFILPAHMQSWERYGPSRNGRTTQTRVIGAVLLVLLLLLLLLFVCLLICF